MLSCVASDVSIRVIVVTFDEPVASRLVSNNVLFVSGSILSRNNNRIGLVVNQIPLETCLKNSDVGLVFAMKIHDQ
jgi:hypothetical protein